MKGVLVVLCPASTRCTTPPPCNQPHPEGASSGRRVSEFVSAHRARGRYFTFKLSWEVCAGMSKLLANRRPWANEPGLSWFLYSADHLGARWARSDSQPPDWNWVHQGFDLCVRVPGAWQRWYPLPGYCGVSSTNRHRFLTTGHLGPHAQASTPSQGTNLL